MCCMRAESLVRSRCRSIAWRRRDRRGRAWVEGGEIVCASRARWLSAAGRCDERGGRRAVSAQRKGRRAKPLAVMVDSVERQYVGLTSIRSRWRRLKMRPADWSVVRAHSKNGLAPAVHPHLNTVGLVRPTTPLHAIVIRDFGRPLYGRAEIAKAIRFSSVTKRRKSTWLASPIDGCTTIGRLLDRLTIAWFASSQAAGDDPVGAVRSAPRWTCRTCRRRSPSAGS